MAVVLRITHNTAANLAVLCRMVDEGYLYWTDEVDRKPGRFGIMYAEGLGFTERAEEVFRELGVDAEDDANELLGALLHYAVDESERVAAAVAHRVSQR